MSSKPTKAQLELERNVWREAALDAAEAALQAKIAELDLARYLSGDQSPAEIAAAHDNPEPEHPSMSGEVA